MRDAWPSLPGGLVDLGGDIAAPRARRPEGGPWRIAVADPRTPGETLGMLLLDAGGVATSGRDAPPLRARRLAPPPDRPGDRRAGAAPGRSTVTVVAPDAAEAEAHATALAISGAGEAAGARRARSPRLSALYVPHAGADRSRSASRRSRRTRVLVRAA